MTACASANPRTRNHHPCLQPHCSVSTQRFDFSQMLVLEPE